MKQLLHRVIDLDPVNGDTISETTLNSRFVSMFPHSQSWSWWTYSTTTTLERSHHMALATTLIDKVGLQQGSAVD